MPHTIFLTTTVQILWFWRNPDAMETSRWFCQTIPDNVAEMAVWDRVSEQRYPALCRDKTERGWHGHGIMNWAFPGLQVTSSYQGNSTPHADMGRIYGLIDHKQTLLLVYCGFISSPLLILTRAISGTCRLRAVNTTSSHSAHKNHHHCLVWSKCAVSTLSRKLENYDELW